MRSLLPAFILLLCLTDSAVAQGLFGPRTIGRGISGRSSTSGSSARSRSSSSSYDDYDTPKSAFEGRRFTREARSANDFVGGSTQSETVGGFVGGQSAAETAVAAAVGITEAAPTARNRRRVIRPLGLYAERLSLSPDLISTAAIIRQSLTAETTKPMAVAVWADTQGIDLQVSADSRNAVLSGIVLSEKDRETAELLLLLEPGIDRVENQLKIAGAPAVPPSLLPANTSAGTKQPLRRGPRRMKR